MTKNLKTQDFAGVVLLKNFRLFPDGRQYIGVEGSVSIMEGKAALGFDVKDESNWIARVEGPKTSVNIPGCQVAIVFEGDEYVDTDPAKAEYFVVP